MPEGGKFGFAAPNAPIREMLAAIEFLLKQTAMANGLAAAVFEVDAKAESGVAKMQREQRELGLFLDALGGAEPEDRDDGDDE